jgi:hypothetical protein
MAMSPAGLGTKNKYAGEDQQQFTRPGFREEFSETLLGENV